MRLLAYGLMSSGVLLAHVVHIWRQRGFFFATCIGLTNHNFGLLVIMNFCLFCSIIVGRMLQRLFFGKLRALEVEHLYERAWFAVTETCLAMTIFRNDFNVSFVSHFGFLLFIKIFHWILQDRIDFMEQQVPASLRRFWVRSGSLIALLAYVDVSLLMHASNYTMLHGPSMLIIFGFEYSLLLTHLMTSTTKFIFHTIEIRRQEPWDEKRYYLFYVDLIADFLKLGAYMVFFALVVHYYGLPLHIIRDLYMTFRSFVQRWRDLVQYRQATANMNARYPTATRAELEATDGVCIICREEMTLTGAAQLQVDVPKKLACGHLFHFHCLRSWLERQQTCPTCRRSVLSGPEIPSSMRPAPQPAAEGDPPPVAPPTPGAPPAAATPGPAPGGAHHARVVVINAGGAGTPTPAHAQLHAQAHADAVAQAQQRHQQALARHQALQAQAQAQAQAHAHAQAHAPGFAYNGSPAQHHGVLAEPTAPLIPLDQFPEFAQHHYPGVAGTPTLVAGTPSFAAAGAPGPLVLPAHGGVGAGDPMTPLHALPHTQLEQLQDQGREHLIHRIHAVSSLQGQLSGIMTQMTQLLGSIPPSPDDAGRSASAPTSAAVHGGMPAALATGDDALAAAVAAVTAASPSLTALGTLPTPTAPAPRPVDVPAPAPAPVPAPALPSTTTTTTATATTTSDPPSTSTPDEES